MLSGAQKQILRDRLVYLYEDRKDHLPLIAKDIELKVPNLYADDITVCCDRLCNAAERQGKIPLLIRRVLEDFPYDTVINNLRLYV